MGDTALALMKYMTAENSSLVDQQQHSERQKLVYFSFFNTWFVKYRFDTAMALYALLLAASVALVGMTPAALPSPAVLMKKEVTEVNEIVTDGKQAVSSRSTAATATTIVTPQSSRPSLTRAVILLHSYIAGAFLGSNIVAFIMRYGLDRPLSWFKNESHCLFLYGPPSLVGKSCCYSFSFQ